MNQANIVQQRQGVVSRFGQVTAKVLPAAKIEELSTTAPVAVEAVAVDVVEPVVEPALPVAIEAAPEVAEDEQDEASDETGSVDTSDTDV